MRIFALLIATLALSTGPVVAEETAGDKAAEAWDTTKQTAKQVGRSTKQTAKEVGHTLKRGTEKVANKIVETVAPDADAHRVEVKLGPDSIDMPKSIPDGKIAFVVTNTAAEKLTFEVAGKSLDERFMTTLSAKQTKVFTVHLERGRYQVSCLIAGKNQHRENIDLRVR
jgi:hypothetical protein